MRVRPIVVVLVLGLLLSVAGCTRVERAEVTRGDSFALEEAIALQQSTYASVYEVIMGSYPEEGSPDERFATKEDTVEFLSATFPPHAAEKIAAAFFDRQGNRRWDSFLPTIYHQGVTVTDAYYEEVRLNQQCKFYLVVEEQYLEHAGDEVQPRRTLYVQDDNGEWKCQMIDGLQWISGAGYTAHGRRSK
jgi:hypothetical protein